jgi:sortase A
MLVSSARLAAKPTAAPDIVHAAGRDANWLVRHPRPFDARARSCYHPLMSMSPDPGDSLPKTVAIAARRLTIINVLVALIILGGFAGGAVFLMRPGALATAQLVTPQTPAATEKAVLTSIPVATMMPTRTPATPTATQTASPTPTLSPTPSVTPSLTRTPVPRANEVTRIIAPAIGLDSKVVSVGIKERYTKGVVEKVWEVADYAAGHHRGSALPGHVGNIVIAAHNNVRGAVFANLYKLVEGDDVYVYLDDVAYRYQVSEIIKVLIKGASAEEIEENLHYIMPADDERLTLVTCWPPWTSTYRLIVICFPAPADL